jgi:hypothetical protein
MYTHTTFAASRALLAARLGDVTKVHWLDDELGMCVVEAIRVYNSITGAHRDTAMFVTTAGTAFYDLSTLSSTSDLRGYSVLDQDWIGLTQYQLMEPKSVLAWTGSEMFTLGELTAAFTRRRDRYLADTGCVVTRSTTSTTALDPVIALDEDVIAVRRAAWASSFSYYYSLFPSDSEVYGLSPSWVQTPGAPSSYTIAAEQNLFLRLQPTPSDNGTLDLITVNNGIVLDPTANSNSGTSIGMPNDLGWGPRFGALAELLGKDGPARDSARAQFCASLYDFAVEIGRNAPAVLSVRINDAALYPTTMTMLDSVTPGWQGKAQDRPMRVAIVGGDLLVLSPVPDGAYSVSVQLVRNAIVPTADGDFLQVPREDLDAVLAWAEMLALFKSNGASLQMAWERAQAMTVSSASYRDRRVLASTYLTEMMEQSTDERRVRPLYSGVNASPVSSSTSTDSDSADARDNATTTQSRRRSLSNIRRRRLGGR